MAQCYMLGLINCLLMLLKHSNILFDIWILFDNSILFDIMKFSIL